MRTCDICGRETSFERTSLAMPPEGDRCEVCDRWVCPYCEDHISPVKFFKMPYPICEECSKEWIERSVK